MRTIMLILRLLFALPFIILMIWGVRVTVWEENFRQAGNSENGELASLQPIPKNPFDFLTSYGETRRLLDTEALNRSRVISVRDEFPFEAILTDGEEIPDASLQLLYANARGASIGAQYCTEVLETIATKCALNRFTASIKEPRREGDTLSISYDFDLAYIPEHEITSGEISRLSTNDLSFRFDPIESKEVQFSVFYRKETVILSLNMAEELCGVLREAYGSCVISRGNLNKSKRRSYNSSQKKYVRVDELRPRFTLEFPGIVETPERLQALAEKEAKRIHEKYQLELARHIIPKGN